MIQTKIVSSMEKCFLDEDIRKFEHLDHISMLKNERLSFQMLYTADAQEAALRTFVKPEISGGLEPYINVRTVENVPVSIPEWEPIDDNHLRTTPGLYPDILQPLHYNGKIPVMRGQLRSAWFEIDPGEGVEAGEYTLRIRLTADDGSVKADERLKVEVIDASLPEQTMKMTQWFHCDCLANYYDCEPWSEKHWKIVENFARTAVRNGINLLLTPTFTPPLDTAVGGERRTTQLVDVTVTKGKYTFGFEKLDRWIEMCDRVGVKYFEIAHFFTQWGAEHAPKVMATVDGEYQRIFGWDTDATGDEYRTFLRAFVKEFLAHMKKRGDDKRCLFHISDEPNGAQVGSYQAAKAVVEDLLEGYTIMDAMSDFNLYKEGAVKTPIPSNNHIEPFIEAEVPGLWTYYCCGQTNKVSNRMIAMPLWRTRSIGTQFFKFDIVGFLQWGYNFYNTLLSVSTLNPFTDVCGDGWVPAGDTCSVYPAQDGTALESMRIVSFHEALQDRRAMDLASELCGKKKVIKEIEKIYGEIRFDRCAYQAETILKVRETVNQMIKKAKK